MTSFQGKNKGHSWKMYLNKVTINTLVVKETGLPHTWNTSQRNQEPGDSFSSWALEKCLQINFISLFIKKHEHFNKNNSTEILNKFQQFQTRGNESCFLFTIDGI